MFYKIRPQSAADTPVLHGDEFLLGGRIGGGGRGADKIGVDVDGGHVVDDYGDAETVVRGVEDALEEGGFARALIWALVVFSQIKLSRSCSSGLKAYQKSREKCNRK